MDKKLLRQQIREKKRAMTPAEIEEKSETLTRLFLESPAYRQAKSLYAYLPYNQEVRTWAIIEAALADGKTVAVPKVYGDTMRFIVLEGLDGIEKGYCGIPEPAADEPVADDPDALVLMPGLAFTRSGDRMGYGGGYYDKFLSAERSHPTLALCFDFQIVESIPTDTYDIPVDTVLWA